MVNKHSKKIEEGHETVEFLFRRMRHKGDLPAFSKHIIEINSKLSSLKALNLSAMGDLANIILKDFSLTNKLLRVVNSAIYGNFSGRVATVSKAVMLLGFEKVRMIASTLLIFDHLENKSMAMELKEAAMESFMSGIIAMKLAEDLKMGRGEEAFICAMLYNLGKMLVICYFPEEYDAIRKLVNEDCVDEEKAVHSVLGISYSEVGMAVSRTWNFPDMIVRSMEKPPPGVIGSPKTEQEILRNLTNYANDLCDVIAKTEEPEWSKAVSEMANRYQKSVPLPVKEVENLLQSTSERIDHFSSIVRLDPKSSKLMNRLSSHLKTEDEHPPDQSSADEPSHHDVQIDKVSDLSKQSKVVTPEMARMIVSNGVNEIADAMKSSYSLNDVMYMILETMYRGCEFHRVIFCLKEVKETKMVARFGLGENAEHIVASFQIDISRSSDIFNIAITKGKGMMIEDAGAPNITKNLPAWYQSNIAAPAFLIYPLVIKGSTIGLFYADKNKKGSLLTGTQQKYMDDLYSMAVDVITQKHGG